jgi:hypothetical protein
VSVDEKWKAFSDDCEPPCHSADSDDMEFHLDSEFHDREHAERLARLLNQGEKHRKALEEFQWRIEGQLASDRGPSLAGLVLLKHIAEEALK